MSAMSCKRLARAVAFLAAVASAASPAAVHADWKDFVPHSLENHAWFETFASFEHDSNSGIARDVEWDDTFIREKLSVASHGYSYDPRFLQYKLSLAGVLKQEDYNTTSFDDGGFENDAALEYDARLFFLPEHHYNGQAFATRYEPVYPQQALNQSGSYVDEYGALASYRLKPWFADVDYLDTTLHQTGLTSNVKRLSVDTQYFRRFGSGNEFSVTGTARPSWYDDDEGLEGDSQEYLASTLTNLKRVRLDSTVTSNRFQQNRGSSDNYDTEQFAWWEQLTVYFPWNLRSDLTWRRNDNDSKFNQPGFPIERKYSDDGTNIQLDLIHRLYESVDTRYRLVSDERDTNGSHSNLLSNSINVDYTKEIPYGQLLAGGLFGRSDIDNRGFASVLNDPYTSTAVPGTITLRQQNADASSVIVQMRSPFPPFDMVTLVAGVHYQVNTAVEPFEIQIVTLPPEFVVPGSYDFFLTYSLLGGEYDLRIDTGGANLTFDMLDSRVSPYFRYLSQRSDVTSGVYPGIPIDSDSYNAGIRLVYGPLRGRAEYLFLDWPVNPYHLWRGEVQYVGSISRSLTAYGSASYVNRHYDGGSDPYTSPETNEDTATLAATLTKQFFTPNVAVSLGGSWSHLSGITDSDAWSANSSLVWRINKLDVTFGFSAYGSNSRTTSDPSIDRDHELIYINLRRQIF